jgi:hypothetical protein
MLNCQSPVVQLKACWSDRVLQLAPVVVMQHCGIDGIAAVVPASAGITTFVTTGTLIVLRLWVGWML